MSWLSRATGIHISPHGAHLSRPDPIGAAKTALSNPLFDAALAIGIPGVGSALGGLGSAIGGAASAIPGVSAIGGALGGLGSGVASAVEGIPGVSSILGAGGAAGGAIPDSAMGIGGGGGGGFGGLLKSGAGWLTGNGGKNALGLAQGVSSVLDQKKSNDYAKKAMSTVENAYNEKAPLRAQGLQGLLNPQHADLSGLAGIAGKLNTSNVPQAGQPQDVSSLLGLQSQIQKLQTPTAGALQQFTPPPRAPLPTKQADAGNPYASNA